MVITAEYVRLRISFVSDGAAVSNEQERRKRKRRKSNMKKASKLLAAALAAVMAFSFAGCSQKDADSSGSSKAPGTSSAGTSSESTLKAMPAIAKDDIKIGVIHISDPAEGSGYTYTHDLGIQKMQTNIGLKDEQIVRKISVDDNDPTAIENAIRECIEEEECNMIFATSWGYMETCKKLAEEFPNVIFCHGTGYEKNDTNFSNYFGRIYQARYLSGIVAGMKTESNKIGYVAAMDKTNSEVTGGIDAFAMGVYSVNPEAKVYVRVTNSWFDPEKESAAAEALLNSGCDVIAQHCDTPNPPTAAESKGKWGVGYNSDMSKDATKATLTSVMWDWSVYYTDAVKKAIEGKWTADIYYGGMKEGLVDIAPLADFCAPGTQEKVDEMRAKIMDGSFNVFDGVIETNDGKTVGEEGKTLDDATITGNIKWYFKNVVESE